MEDEAALEILINELPDIEDPYIAFSQLLEVNGQVKCDAQLQLCEYGLVLVCLKLINDNSIRTSMMAMQMLKAILDGESGDVRESTVGQLSIPKEELFVSAYRKLLEIGMQALDNVYKAAQHGDFSIVIKESGLLLCGDALSAITSMCAQSL